MWCDGCHRCMVCLGLLTTQAVVAPGDKQWVSQTPGWCVYVPMCPRVCVCVCVPGLLALPRMEAHRLPHCLVLVWHQDHARWPGGREVAAVRLHGPGWGSSSCTQRSVG
jgi:hypothetical protein